jgi:hypothetical protein
MIASAAIATVGEHCRRAAMRRRVAGRRSIGARSI